MVDKLNAPNTLQIAIHSAEVAGWRIALTTKVFGERIVKNFVHQCRFSTTRNACYSRNRAKRELNVDVLQIVFARTLNADKIAPLAPHFGNLYFKFAGQILRRKALAVSLQLLMIALKNHFTAKPSGHRTNVDNLVGSADNVLVVFHNNHRVADALQIAQHFD